MLVQETLVVRVGEVLDVGSRRERLRRDAGLRGHGVGRAVDARLGQGARRRPRLPARVDPVTAFHVLVVVRPVGEMVLALQTRVRPFTCVLTTMCLRTKLIKLAARAEMLGGLGDWRKSAFSMYSTSLSRSNSGFRLIDVCLKVNQVNPAS